MAKLKRAAQNRQKLFKTSELQLLADACCFGKFSESTSGLGRVGLLMMHNPDDASVVRRIFEQVGALAPGREREDFLDAACGKDQELRKKVVRLLEAKPESVALERAVERLSGTISEWKRAAPAGASRDGLVDEFPDSPAPTVPLPRVGAFTILGRLGEGGMGIVFRAQQAPPLSREVALKVIKPGMDSREVLRRFTLEQEALARMEHPNIAQVLSSGLTNLGQPFFAMELVRGASITDFCEQQCLSLTQRLELFMQVCDAVEHAHQKGIVHRDLKPSNLLVTTISGTSVVKVIDFGVAKALDIDTPERTAFTQLAQFVGSPLYMSPEQVAVDRARIDPRSDVYSLGAVLYELTTGSPPIERDNFRQAGLDGIRQLITEGLPPPPSARLRDRCQQGLVTEGLAQSLPVSSGRIRLPREIDWIVMRALAKQPNQRYNSAQEFMDDLQRFQSGKPPIAAPPLLGYRVSHWVRKHRSSLRTAVALLLLSLGVGWLASRWAREVPVDTPKPIDQIDAAPAAESQESVSLASVQDQLEASALTQLLHAFREQNLARMSEISLPRTTTGQLLGVDQTSQAPAYGISLRETLLDAAHPRPLRSFEHPAAVFDVAISPDQALLATACADRQVRIWNLATGELIHLMTSHRMQVEAVAFAPDGSQLASGDKDGVIKLWDVSSGNLNFSSETRPAGIESLQWSPDGNFLAAGVRYEFVEVLHPDGTSHAKFEGENPRGPRYENVLFTPDSQRLLAAEGSGGKINVWDLNLKTLAGRIDVSLPIHYARAMTWIEESGRWLMVGDINSDFLLLVDGQANDATATMIPTGYVHAQEIAYSPESGLLACAYLSGKVALLGLTPPFDHTSATPTNKLIFNAHAPEPGATTSLKWMSAGRLLTSGDDGRVHIWNVADLYPWRYAAFDQGAATVSMNASDFLLLRRHDPSDLGSMTLELRKLATLSEPTAAAKFSQTFRTAPHRFQTHIPPHNCDLAMDHDQRIIAVKSTDSIQLYSLTDMNLLGNVPTGGTDIKHLSVSNLGKYVATVNLGGEITVWRKSANLPTTYSEAARWPAAATHMPPIFSPSGLTLYHFDRNLRIEKHVIDARESETGKLLHRRWDDNTEQFCLSANGELLAIATKSGLRVSKVNTGEFVFEQWDGTAPRGVFFCDADRILLSWRRDMTFRAWHLPTGQDLGSFPSPRLPPEHEQGFSPWGTSSPLGFWTSDSRGISLWYLGASVPRAYR